MNTELLEEAFVSSAIAQQYQAQELQKQILSSQLLAEVTLKIRQSLQLGEILQTTVTEVQRILQADRVLIFQLHPDGSGRVVKESVINGFSALISHKIVDPCFRSRFLHLYRQGRISATTDVEQMDLENCYADFLRQFSVRANLVVPILLGRGQDPLVSTAEAAAITDQETAIIQPSGQFAAPDLSSPVVSSTAVATSPTLWGLLVAHQCEQPRHWTDFETKLLQQLANQVGIAIAQSQLVDALRDSEERFHAAFEHAATGMALTALDGRFIQVNSALCELVGYTKSELLTRTFQEITHPDDLKADLHQFKQLLTEDIRFFHLEKRCIHRQGHTVWVLVSVSLIRDNSGQPLYCIAQMQDITERARLEAERKQAEQQILQQAALLDIATDAILVRDLNHQILFWNHAAERLYGWRAEAAIGSSALDLFPAITDVLQEILQAVLQTGEWQGELNLETREGKAITVASRWTLVRNDTGLPTSILIVDTDITEKKQLERQFLRAQRLESIGTLASGIAHDLNNILTPILAAAQLLQLKHPDLDQRSNQLLDVLATNAKRGADLVKQVLSFARGVEGKQMILQVHHLITEVIKILRETFPKSITVLTNVPTDLWLVCGDSTQLHQVLMNLCVNARDAMPDGGSLTITAENRQIDEPYARMNLEARVGSYIVITVADTGMGIAPEMIDRVFEPFFTTKQTGKGTGLGLSTALGILRSHGGFINVSSTVGQGTQFRLFLPAVNAIAEPTINQPEPQPGNRELILLVDDEAAIREVTKAALETYDFEVLVAQDGIEAIALYARHQAQISLVLMDIMMPAMDGATAIRTLQKMNPQVKVIATSGLTTNQKVSQTAGADAFLAKPYTTRELLEVIHSLLCDT